MSELQWHKLIPMDRHAEFLAGERKHCKQEEKAFHAATEGNVEQLRATVLQKREEYLLMFLEHEL